MARYENAHLRSSMGPNVAESDSDASDSEEEITRPLEALSRVMPDAPVPPGSLVLDEEIDLDAPVLRDFLSMQSVVPQLPETLAATASAPRKDDKPCWKW